MLTALIIDEDLHEARRLAMMLRQASLFSTVKVARDAREGADAMRTLAPDIAFVDGAANGLGVTAAQSIGERTSVVVLADEGDPAIAALRANETDHVLKPVSCRAVLEVLARVRARRQLAAQGLVGQDVAGISDLYDDAVWVSGRRGHTRVPLATVEVFEADRDYVRVWASGASQLMRGPLQTISQRLDPARFVRVHRSAIVNLDQIEEMRRAPNGRMRLRLRSGRELMVSAGYAETTRELVREHAAGTAVSVANAGPFAIFQR